MFRITFYLKALLLIIGGSFGFIFAQLGDPEPMRAVFPDLVWTAGSGTIQDVAYSPDGKTIAVATSINIRLHDAKDLTLLRELWAIPGNKMLKGLRLVENIGHYGDVLSVDFSPDGRYLAHGDDNRLILEELYDYLQENVKHTAGYLDREQTPTLEGTNKNRVLGEVLTEMTMFKQEKG